MSFQHGSGDRQGMWAPDPKRGPPIRKSLDIPAKIAGIYGSYTVLTNPIREHQLNTMGPTLLGPPPQSQKVPLPFSAGDVSLTYYVGWLKGILRAYRYRLRVIPLPRMPVTIRIITSLGSGIPSWDSFFGETHRIHGTKVYLLSLVDFLILQYR